MARPLRYIPTGALVEVTTRTVHGRLLLRPSREVNAIVVGIIGRGQTLFPVRIYGLVVMSNHWHALISGDNAAQIAAFMAFVNGNIAREIGRLHNWRDRFWARRYRAIVVADDTASIFRLQYFLQNGCKEGLVDRPVDWPGVSCVRAYTAGHPLEGVWHDRTAEYQARRRGVRISPAEFATRYEVILTRLPVWQGLSTEEYRAAFASLISDIEAETQTERAVSGRRCLGRDAVLAQHPHDLPDESDCSPAPPVHATSAAVRWAFLQEYAAFVDAFRTAAELLRSGEQPEFPLGSFPPRAPFVAAPAPA